MLCEARTFLRAVKAAPPRHHSGLPHPAILHNLLGYLTGFGVGKLLKLDSTKCRAISIEVGMQNSGLATSLAAAHFAQYPLATIPGAVFSVWHNISGAVLANFFARTAEKKD